MTKKVGKGQIELMESSINPKKNKNINAPTRTRTRTTSNFLSNDAGKLVFYP